MRVLNTQADDPAKIRQLLDRSRLLQGTSRAQVSGIVAELIAQVREKGDEALIELTARFDGVKLNKANIRVTPEDLEQAPSQVSESFMVAIRQAKANILEFHRRQLPKDWLDIKDDGIVLGQRYQPVAAAGLYIPGGTSGTTPLVSSLLMCAIPAQVAGVKRIVVCTPPNAAGGINPYLLAAARECGIQDIYKCGGAQAIAAMAFGTPTIPPVQVIVGPGNQYVTEAKRQVFGYVGIDMLAGPSEILIIADDQNNPAFIAADLLSQAEHGPKDEAGAFLLTPSVDLALAVNQTLEQRLEALPRNQIARASLEASGGIIITADLDEAFELANFTAPEHLELMVADPWTHLGRLKNAGAIFIGPYSTEPIGDYVAGTNHVLPTNSTARFASGLNVEHFIKKTSIISYSHSGISKYGPAAMTIAAVEGLDAHARAVELRLGQSPAPDVPEESNK